MPSNTTSNMFFYTYVLISLKDGRFYMGYTSDLKRRIEEHNSGKSFSTEPRRPLKLVYYEACLNKEDAENREDYLKSTIGRRYLSKRLRNFKKQTQNFCLLK
ncbi:MAG: GIY-YIG nuclease family protein [bacterium]|nr:GIY-YIG nuclease family protein [bacterium]